MKRLLFLAISVLLVLAACGKQQKSEQAGSEGKLDIYTTVYPLQYFTERIGGDQVSVHTIYPPGADSHSFEPTQKDMITLADSDIFFYIGLGLEGFVENAKKTLKSQNVEMVATADGIPADELLSGHHHHDGDEGEEHGHGHEKEGGDHDHDHAHGEIDPHIWVSPSKGIELAETITNTLIEKRPQQKEMFTDNFLSLKKDLEGLDQQFKDMTDQADRKTFFISHASFGYLAHDYGLDQVSIAGLNSQSEPSQKELAKIVAQAKNDHVDYILFEQNISSKLTEVILKEVGAQPLTLHNLAVLTPEDIAAKEDYFTLMKHNIETLKTALRSK